MRAFLFSVILVVSATSIAAQHFNYIVLQWPGSYCGSAKNGCCFPQTGKPAADFTIAGLWPYNIDGTSLTFCSNHTHLHLSKVMDLSKSLEKEWPKLTCPSSESKILWSQEWLKYGSCSSPNNQHAYFKSALEVKRKTSNLLQVLKNAGITPNGGVYDTQKIVEAVAKAFIYMPGVVCNQDKSGINQLYQILLCADGASNIMDCPGLPNGNCSKRIKFPPF